MSSPLSESAAYQLCHNEETYFSGNCYKVVKDRKTWDEANEVCEENGGSLMAIESKFQQLFISDYLLSSLKADISAHNVAVWTAGRMMMNSTHHIYAWTRNIHMKEIDLWEDSQLQMTEGSCIEVDSRSMFRDWILANCSNDNYFICSRPAKMGESRNVQCMCRNGYRGSFCDQSFSESGTTLLRHSLRNIESVAFESQSVACVDNEFEFLCPHGGSILVDFAAYGNIGESDEICLTSVPTKVNVTYWEECIHPSSLQTMISMCQGLTYCRIKDLQSLFPDSPCLPTTPITLQYRMRCLFEPMTTCPLHAIYQNGRCYVPYVTEEPLSMYNAQTKCRKEGGQLAFSVGQVAQNEIAAIVRKQAGNDGSSCYWMDGRLGDSSLCECYYISRRNAFWSQRNCNSSQQWVCQFAPESKPTEIYDKFVEQHAIVDGLTNVERFE
ncbi:hypothetical protein LOAG_07548 [Loa loa]|uniref:C-type lectin domain-containing protein n=1 Tax=Loa loa TaxID=7209 RepID=A0A1S0TVN1_LOALO|nr:hypothetical protein LOAG_07548 [Loa loa]EFO20942.1 hypothetical protein LOAG_07548 [Loa loa]